MTSPKLYQPYLIRDLPIEEAHAKALKSEYNKQYRLRNAEKTKARNDAAYRKAKEEEGTGKTPAGWKVRNAEHHARIKAALIAYLGGKCVRCGFSDGRALQADHIHGGGRLDVRSSYSRYRAILAGKHEGEFQLLCANCNRIKQWENWEFRGYLSK